MPFVKLVHLSGPQNRHPFLTSIAKDLPNIARMREIRAYSWIISAAIASMFTVDLAGNGTIYLMDHQDAKGESLIG